MRPRIRTIKPEFWDSESIGQVSVPSRLAFIGLWSMADDQGRLRGGARRVRKVIFGYDNFSLEEVEKFLHELESVRLVQCYEVDGESYIAITGWSEHQRVDKPRQSKLPAPNSKKPRETSRHVEKSSRGPDRIPIPIPSISCENSEAEPSPPTRRSRDDQDWESESVALMESIPVTLRSRVEDLIDLRVSENKSGVMRTSRIVREILRPAARWLSGDVALDAAQAGLDGALSAGAPNINYAKKASESHRERRLKPNEQKPTSYDALALKLLEGGIG